MRKEKVYSKTQDRRSCWKFRTPSGWPGFVFLLFLIVLSGGWAGAQTETEGLEDRMKEIRRAVDAERYEQALEQIREAQDAYPGAAGPYRAAGDLFADKRLFEMAVENYEQADHLKPGDYEIMTSLAEAYGKVDSNRQAVEVLEELREIYPEDPSVLSDLGWMYFKTYQVEKGVALLEAALKENPESYGFMMTLGTLYSSLYREEKAEENYQKSIELAQEMGDRYFASVAHYNLGILYHNFYRYEDALEETSASLQMRERSSGHILRGELFQSRMEFSRAMEEFSRAREMDQTPLSLLNHAYLYSRFGMMDQARVYLDEVLAEEDLSWMYNYGIDLNHYEKDLHELQRDIFQGLARRAARTPPLGLWDGVKRWIRGLVSRARGKYHDFQYRRYSWIISGELLEEENLLDGWWIRYQALRGYGAPAERYLQRASDFERKVAPESAPFYEVEWGREGDSLDHLLRAARELDPLWEAETLSETLGLILREHRRGLSGKEEARLSRQLFLLNPGGLRAEGIRLPVVLEWKGEWSFWGRFWLKRKLSRNFRFLAPDSRGGAAALKLSLVRAAAEEAGAAFRWVLAEPSGEALETAAVSSNSWGGAAQKTVDRVFSLD